MFYTCEYSCNYCSVVCMITCVCFSTGISILCNNTKFFIVRKCGQCRLAPLHSLFCLFFPREYEVLILNMFSVCVYDDMPLTRLLSCLTTVSISFCLSLSFFRNWEKILFFLLVSFILHQEQKEEPMKRGAYMPSAFYWTFSENTEVRYRIKSADLGRIQFM